MRLTRSLRRCLSIQAHELHPGVIIKLQNKYVEIMSYRHLKTGQGHTESIAKYMDLATFKVGKLHVNTHHKFDKIEADYVPAIVQYFESDKVIVSDNRAFDPIQLPLSLFQGAQQLFPPGTAITLVMDEEEIIKIAVSPDKLEELRRLKPKEKPRR